MTKKVKLTREQAEAIELIRGDINEGLTLGNIRAQLKKRWMNKPYATLNELTFEQFIVAVLGDYEIEKTFEVGDWVIRIEEGSVNNGIDFINVEKGYTFEVTSKNDAGTCVCGEGRYHSPKKLRHATPEEIAEEKQRRWWAKHGRKVWELREGDILYYDDEFHEVESVEDIGVVLLSTNKVYIDVNYIKSKYYVTCFAEDRKDI